MFNFILFFSDTIFGNFIFSLILLFAKISQTYFDYKGFIGKGLGTAMPRIQDVFAIVVFVANFAPR